MRTVSMWLLAASLIVVGCTDADDVDHSPCDDLLACAAVAAPDKLNEHLGNYGQNGSCWKSLDRALCEKSCSSLIAQIATAKPGVAECAGTAGVGPQDGGTSADLGSSDMSAPPACSPVNCTGCCAGDVCKAGGASDSCGQGGTACAVCGAPQICTAARSCGVDPNERIRLTIVDATIVSTTPSGLSWDSPLGSPDPYVTINGSVATRVIDDTTWPVWGATHSFTRAEIMGSGIVLQMFDKDVSFDDVIASARTLKVTEADLAKGRIDWFNWDSVRSIRLDVTR